MRGRRTQWAQTLRCQTSFVSQVLTERAHLSLEHAVKTAQFLNHNSIERDYFMLLVQKGRSGSVELSGYFDSQMRKILKDREQIKSRIQVQQTLSEADQMKYYSTWHYSAAHVLSALPGLNTLEAMSRRLMLAPKKTKQILEFLEERKFVQKDKGEYKIGSARIHLENGSPMLPRHHANWRMKAIDAIDSENEKDLHYSAVLGISKKDQEKFKEKLLKLLEEFEPMIRDSKEEVPVIMNLDLFEL